MAQSDPEKHAILLPLLKLAIFTLVAPGTVTFWLPLFYLFPEIRHETIEVNFLALDALFLIALGAAGYCWCGFDFAFAGKGTPAPIDPPRVLVVRGLYEKVRNPMYISVLFILLGESLLFKSEKLLAYAAAIAFAFHLFVVFYEEPALKRKMGSAYDQYLKDVPRWIPALGGQGPGNAL